VKKVRRKGRAEEGGSWSGPVKIVSEEELKGARGQIRFVSYRVRSALSNNVVRLGKFFGDDRVLFRIQRVCSSDEAGVTFVQLLAVVGRQEVSLLQLFIQGLPYLKRQ